MLEKSISTLQSDDKRVYRTPSNQNTARPRHTAQNSLNHSTYITYTRKTSCKRSVGTTYAYVIRACVAPQVYNYTHTFGSASIGVSLGIGLSRYWVQGFFYQYTRWFGRYIDAMKLDPAGYLYLCVYRCEVTRSAALDSSFYVIGV